jgi:hypothetical protein
MKVYSLTKLGSRIAKTKTGDSPEMKVLQYLYENRTATDSEIETATGEKYVCGSLQRRGLIQELTT